jgi:hypothetical protein
MQSPSPVVDASVAGGGYGVPSVGWETFDPGRKRKRSVDGEEDISSMSIMLGPSRWWWWYHMHDDGDVGCIF